jgi:hypothetical protein
MVVSRFELTLNSGRYHSLAAARYSGVRDLPPYNLISRLHGRDEGWCGRWRIVSPDGGQHARHYGGADSGRQRPFSTPTHLHVTATRQGHNPDDGWDSPACAALAMIHRRDV